MKVRWLAGAIRSFRAAHHYIRIDNQKAAAEVAKRIEYAVARLADYPSLGSPGRRAGTRELVVPGVPFIVIYRVGDSDVQILRVFHTSQNRPLKET